MVLVKMLEQHAHTFEQEKLESVQARGLAMTSLHIMSLACRPQQTA